MQGERAVQVQDRAEAQPQTTPSGQQEHTSVHAAAGEDNRRGTG